MDCEIKHIVDSNGEERYWCIAHRAPANNDKECLSEVKEFYDNIIPIKKDNVKSLKAIYTNVDKKLIPEIVINGNEIRGIIKISSSLIEPKDFGGLMLSALNGVNFEVSVCPYCGHYHSDDGLFAYTPHAKHLCQYCGKFFDIKTANIGNEFAMQLEVPKITLNDEIVEIKNSTTITYNVFEGTILINNVNANRVKINNNITNTTDYLNDLLKEKY